MYVGGSSPITSPVVSESLPQEPVVSPVQTPRLLSPFPSLGVLSRTLHSDFYTFLPP